MFHTNPAKKGCACNAAFNMLHARLCTCRTDYIDMNKLELACLLLLPLWESVIVLCFVVRYFMSILVLQSS